jgi:hypothetical protein
VRHIVLLGFLMTLPAVNAQPAGASDCQGGIWQKIEAAVGTGSNLKSVVAFLKTQGIAFHSRDLMDEPKEARV